MDETRDQEAAEIERRMGIIAEAAASRSDGPGWWAYGGLVVFVVLALTGVILLAIQAKDERMAQCEAGNTRSQIQKEDLETTAAQTENLDIERLLGLTPETAAEVRRVSRENAERRILALPFLDCRTGKKLPPPTTTTVPSQP